MKPQAILRFPGIGVAPFATRFREDPAGHHVKSRNAGSAFRLPAIGCYGMARHAKVQKALNSDTFVSRRSVGMVCCAHETPLRSPLLLSSSDTLLKGRTHRVMKPVVSGSLREMMPVRRARRTCSVAWRLNSMLPAVGELPVELIPA
jgi:hypothetical protein